MRRKENLPCVPLPPPTKTAVFHEEMLALMFVAVVCISSPWFSAYLAEAWRGMGVQFVNMSEVDCTRLRQLVGLAF